MPLSRLENFLVNTDGNILYVNPSDLDATDSFDNKGNSLTRPFITIQRALIEAARFAYQSGQNNDKFDRTTILLYPGEHVIDNRPGLYVKDNSGSPQYFDVNKSDVTGTTDIELDNGSIFDLNNVDNVLYKFNSIYGGAIVPKGTSIVGLDLRKTKVRPLYVPNPDFGDDVIPRSALFRVTGGCYFWQFSMFDANQSVYFSKNFTEKRNPNISHHKLTCFEYADGINDDPLTETTDLQQYYFKLMNAYGTDTGNRNISDYPINNDFEPNTPESKIVGDLSANDNDITELTSTNLNATVTTQNAHGLTIDDQILITGVGSTDLYNGTYRVTGITSDRQFSYNLNADATDDVVNLALNPNAKVTIEADTVTGASPYIFNCSLRSVFGMCGLHADGSKATGFKSMVVAQFTGIGLQKDDKAFVIYKPSTGDYLNSVDAAADPDINTPLYLNPESQYRKRYDNFHIKVSNDSFIQAVSVFAIGFSNHFLAESGGEQSITNSNSNFGNKALVSKGFKANAFNRDDTGYVTHIVPPKDLQKEETNIIWRILDPIKTKAAATTSRLYIKDEKDVTNPPTNVVNGFRIGAKKDDKLFLNVNVGGQNVTYSSPILMPVASGDGPVAEKKFTVDRTASGNNIASKEITLTENHNFLDGESVRVFADNGRTPDGIEIGRKYFVITVAGTGNEKKIKLANTQSDALAGTVVPDEINTKGGILTVQSTVTDKIPGEIGHPIQFDSSNVTYTRDGASVTEVGGWYILGSSDATNLIFSGFNTGTNAVTIDQKNSSTYVQRRSESRALDDRIYRLRYVIPKDFVGANIAKKPEKNYVLQESKTVGEDATITSVISNRNPRVIAGIATDGTTSTINIVTTEIPHKLSVNDKVKIRNVRSSANTTGEFNSGYNGLFTVTGTPSSKTFTYTNQSTPGTYTDITADARAGTNDRTLTDLPVLERVEYDTSYTIQEVETIQEYISGQQDGVFYLTCLIGNVSPTVSEFSDSRYKQNFLNLYPTVDKDNPNNDPVQSVSAASNETLGKVNVNNSLNSITKESTINYLRDNRIGFAVTFAESDIAGITTLTSKVEHNLNSVTAVSFSNPNAYASGAGTIHNVTLISEAASVVGSNATADVTTNNAGTITEVKIIDGGSAYGIGNTMRIGSGKDAIAQVTSINNAVGNAIQVVGVGSTTNRTNSGYNGLYKITAVPSPKSVQYTHVAQGENAGSSVGVYTGPVNTTSGVFTLLDEKIGISGIAGVAGTNLPGIVTVTTSVNHNLAVGNKIKVAGLVGTARTVYNGFDFVVKEKVSNTVFTMKSTLAIPVTGEAGAELYKYGLNSFGQDNSLASEKIAGSLSPLLTGIDSKLLQNTAAAGTGNPATSTISITSTVGFNVGDFVQIGNEIIRIVSKNADGLRFDGYRGVLGTQSVVHVADELVRKINVIPSELHRFSAIRASGHTFEYIGYGPGNYSTSLPQKIKKQIELEQELLAISREEDGGIVFFSGMNDRGDFFSGQRAEPREIFLGEIGDSNSAIFDDVFIRNTLRVGGGPNQNLPSEFNGPVNFSNKVTSTSLDGIEAIKLLIKGNALNNPSFQVGDDTNPSLLVDKDTQNVGIKNASPQHELDVNGTIRANVYENFKLSDLPDATEETTFARNRVIKVNEDGSGYEMVDPHELSAYELRSLGVSNDGSVYSGLGEIENGKLKITGISTDKFFLDERVKLFGVTESTDSVEVPDPVTNNTVKIETVPTTGFSTAVTYYYWQAQYHLKNGKVGVSSQISPTGNYATNDARTGVTNTVIQSFNDLNHNALKLQRTSDDHGILIYRQSFVHPSGNNATLDQKISKDNANLGQAKLIAVLGQRELGSTQTSAITWKDFGVYEQTAWSPKGTVNEFLGSDTSTTETHQIHFPTIGTEGQRRGWDIDKIVSIGQNSITVDGNYNLNNMNGVVGFGTTTVVKVVHDNTKALSDAIARTSSAGGNYLDLPSGTYLTSKIIIPTKFSLRGNGKNSIIKQQYYATDATDQGVSGGTALAFNGNLVGAAVANPTDITIADITFDGNSSNNIMFELDNDNNLLTFEGGTSMLFKDMEIRNSSGGGFYARNSKRISIENSTIVDGGLTDRYNIRPLDVQNSETVRINDCLFENFAGPLDVSVTTVTATGGNIIRNCGSGIDAYATGKITTQNNIILGPSDEFIASPDIYDSDFDSINITIDSVNDDPFLGPALLYIEDGEGYDVSSSKVELVAGIGTMVGLFSTTRTATLGTKFAMFDVLTQDSNPEGIGRENGYIQLKMNKAEIDSAQTSTGETLSDFAFGSNVNEGLGYEIVGTEYLEKPVGFSTVIGITTGYWANGAGYGAAGGGFETNAGVAVTQYVVRIEDVNQISGISTGDFVKLPGHSMSPNLAGGVVPDSGYTDETGGAITVNNGLRVDDIIGSDRIVLTGFRIPSSINRSNGSNPVVGDYISIRRIFTIAKGRVGVT